MKHIGKIEIMVFVFGFLALGMNACSEATNKSEDTGVTIVDDGNARSVHEVVIEGCEYFYVESNFMSGITHKGNCSNPMHCINSEPGDVILNTTNISTVQSN